MADVFFNQWAQTASVELEQVVGVELGTCHRYGRPLEDTQRRSGKAMQRNRWSKGNPAKAFQWLKGKLQEILWLGQKVQEALKPSPMGRGMTGDTPTTKVEHQCGGGAAGGLGHPCCQARQGQQSDVHGRAWGHQT